MTWSLETPGSIDALCSVLMQLSEKSTLACRGQGKEWNRLTPSFDRTLERGQGLNEPQCAEFECRTMRVFHEQAASYLSQSEIGHMNWLFGTLLLMQHHGAPTRLLDWTRSPWVAAYFCVLSHPADNGEIWIFDYDEVERRTFSGLTQKVIGSPIQQTWAQNRFEPVPEHWFATFRPIAQNPRMMAQQSIFTVAGLMQDHDALIDRYLDGQYVKMRILVPSMLKQKMQGRLMRMNVTASALFPGIDGLGRFIAQLAESWLPTS